MPFETDHCGHPGQLAAHDRAERDARRDLVVKTHHRRTQPGLQARAHGFDAVGARRESNHLEVPRGRKPRDLPPHAHVRPKTSFRADGARRRGAAPYPPVVGSAGVAEWWENTKPSIVRRDASGAQFTAAPAVTVMECSSTSTMRSMPVRSTTMPPRVGIDAP